jgi:hypothetical protein
LFKAKLLKKRKAEVCRMQALTQLLIFGMAVMAITKAWQSFNNEKEVKEILKKRAFLVVMMRI